MTNSNLSNSSPSSPASSRTIQSGSSMQSCLNSTLICLSYGSLLSKLTAQQNSLSSNPSTASVTVATTTATGVDKSSVVPSALHQKSDRLIQSGLFQGSVPSPVPSSPSAIISSSSIAHHQHQHKMTGGIRRTVSSATPCSTGMGSMNTSARPVHQQAPIGVTKSLSSNTQQTAVRGAPATHISTKDPHKKLDRSFSEPAEKKGASAAAAAAAAAAASSLGPSSRYKTELCRSFAEVGSCKYGDKCQFAHGEEELRTVSRHPKFKTENCKSFHSTGFCPYGPRCHFIHNDESGKKINSSNSSSSSSAVPSSPSAIVGSQRMFEPVIGAPNNSNQSVNQHNVPVTSFASTSPSAVLNNNLVRPKALSLGSYSLGSSGEISSPSSQSGSPTSLNSFFTEDSGILSGTPFCLSGSNSRLHSNALTSAFPPPASNNQHQNPHSPFSFSPDSAFVSFNGTNSNSGSNSSTSSGSSMSFGGSQKCIFGGSQPTLSSRFSPVEQCLTNSDETANSVLYSLFGSTPFGHPDHHSVQQHQQFSDLYRTMSPIGKPSQLHYPLAPESPVDSVASEIEALKLGEPHLSAFAPISPSFSTSSLSTASSSPPLNSGSMLMHQQQQSELEQALNASGAFGAVHIPRLPTFTKFATTIGGQLTNIAHE